MKTSTILIIGAVGVGGVLYLRGRQQLEATTGNKPSGFSFGGVLDAVRAGVRGYSGSPDTSESGWQRVGNALDGFFGSILGRPPAVDAATDIRYSAPSSAAPPLAHDKTRATQLQTGQKPLTWDTYALSGVYD